MDSKVEPSSVSLGKDTRRRKYGEDVVGRGPVMRDKDWAPGETGCCWHVGGKQEREGSVASGSTIMIVCSSSGAGLVSLTRPTSRRASPSFWLLTLLYFVTSAECDIEQCRIDPSLEGLWFRKENISQIHLFLPL